MLQFQVSEGPVHFIRPIGPLLSTWALDLLYRTRIVEQITSASLTLKVITLPIALSEITAFFALFKNKIELLNTPLIPVAVEAAGRDWQHRHQRGRCRLDQLGRRTCHQSQDFAEPGEIG